MKKIIYSILICFGTVVLSSCEDTSEDISKVTHFASLELKGETAMKMKLNDTYVEPGFIALEGDDILLLMLMGFQFQRSVMFWLLHLLLPVPIMENQNLAAATM